MNALRLLALGVALIALNGCALIQQLRGTSATEQIELSDGFAIELAGQNNWQVFQTKSELTKYFTGNWDFAAIDKEAPIILTILQKDPITAYGPLDKIHGLIAHGNIIPINKNGFVGSFSTAFLQLRNINGMRAIIWVYICEESRVFTGREIIYQFFFETDVGITNFMIGIPAEQFEELHDRAIAIVKSFKRKELPVSTTIY